MNPLVLLAKSAVEKFIGEKRIVEIPNDFPKDFLERKAGTFVTIEKDGELRGCIGTDLPTRINVAEEIIYNAIAAAIEDCRFEPIQEKELNYLIYTVYILGCPGLARDIKELNPEKFGIIVRTSPFTFSNEKEVVFDGVVPYKTGLLLPDLEGVDTAEKQISIACQKGGINPEGETIFIYKFTVEKYQ